MVYKIHNGVLNGDISWDWWDLVVIQWNWMGYKSHKPLSWCFRCKFTMIWGYPHRKAPNKRGIGIYLEYDVMNSIGCHVFMMFMDSWGKSKTMLLVRPSLGWFTCVFWSKEGTFGVQWTMGRTDVFFAGLAEPLNTPPLISYHRGLYYQLDWGLQPHNRNTHQPTIMEYGYVSWFSWLNSFTFQLIECTPPFGSCRL